MFSLNVVKVVTSEGERSPVAAAPIDPKSLFRPIMIRPGKSGKPVKVGRADLDALCRRIIDATADIAGRAALVKAGNILTGWVSARPHLIGSSWERQFRKLARGLKKIGSGATTKTPFQLFGKGNGKLPFATWSTLPVFTCPGAGECAKWCYSFRSWRYPAPFARQLQNTLLLWYAPEIIRSKFLALPEGITFRLHVDGDFASLEDISFWMEALSARPDIACYTYSKSWDLLRLWGGDHKNAWPQNFLLNLSTGGRGLATEQHMRALPITRGVFACVSVRGVYRPAKKGNVGFARYDDEAYYRAVKEVAQAKGMGKKVFLCPGKCGDCTPKGHACGMPEMRGVLIVNGEH